MIIPLHLVLFLDKKYQKSSAIDASARSEKAMEIQAKRQDLLPLGLMKNQTYTAVRPANIPFRRSGLLYRISYGFFIHPESFRGRPADRAGSRTRPGEA